MKEYIIISALFLLTIVLIITGCSTTRESSLEPAIPMAVNPTMAHLNDSSQTARVLSWIQSDKESILANSIEFVNGSYRLSVPKELADSLGIDIALYNRYSTMVEALNYAGK